MLLVTITVDGTTHYISDDYHKLTHMWKAKIDSLSDARYATARKYGGYVEPVFGTLSVLPDIGLEKTGTVIIQMANTREEDATTLFQGTLHREDWERDHSEYRLYGEDESEVAAVSFSGFLQTEFSSECTSLGLTLDATGTTRAATLSTYYVPSGDVDRLTALSDLAAFYSHYFWIDDGILYLADMLLSRGDTLELTEFKVLPSSYRESPPYSQFTSDDESVDGSYAYGKEFSVSPKCHSNGPLVEDALGDIKTIMERHQIVISAPLVLENIPNIGQKITLTDDSMEESIDIEMWARAIIYDFDNYEMIVEGDGTIT